MKKKFARLKYSGSRDDIVLKYKILKKAPAKLFDWYIYKFNPYKIEETSLFGQDGYIVTLPLLKSQADNDAEKAEKLISRTVASLKDHYVEIILPPERTNLSYIDKISIATGEEIMPFFLPQAIKKALKTVRKDIMNAEILVLAGGKLTEGILYNIYEELNYLSVMIPDGDITKYSTIAEEIFGETGLNIQFTGFNKSVLDSADIIINAAELDEKQFYGFKRSAVLFDICGSRQKRIDLIRKRDDMLVVDDFRLKSEDETFNLAEFETAFYLLSKEFRMIFLRGYDHRVTTNIKKSLSSLDIKITGFRSLDAAISQAAINGFLKRL